MTTPIERIGQIMAEAMARERDHKLEHLFQFDGCLKCALPPRKPLRRQRRAQILFKRRWPALARKMGL